MKKFSSKVLLGLVIAVAGFSASAQEFKVGVVNLDRIFREANSAKAAQTKLEQEFSKREKELTDMAAQLKTQSDKFEREAPTLAESQRTTRQRQLVDQDRTFQTKRREFQEDLSARKNEELQLLLKVSAGLKLRMAGPALGRILRKRLKQGFVSANLPLLHKRTIQTTYSNEFRSGIFREKNLIDISLEFNRQFWGDVMLFTLENLTELGYPDKRLGLPEITETAYDIQEKIWLLYKKRQDEIETKTETIERYLTDKGSWWNRGPGVEHALKNMDLFCSQIRNNFGGTSESMKKISGEIEEGASIAMIINAIHSFYEIDIAWNELLKSSLTVPLN